jgi:AraC family transcriptional regulator, regulatory protein of adaptative response / methylated-DNA-[protein]-cysteine methyltransferase
MIAGRQSDSKARVGVSKPYVAVIMATSRLMKKTDMTMTSAMKKREASVVDDPRWARIIAHDRTADGLFWYSVVTTGVYCRPSCAARTANPKNVQLHDTLESAKATGFRPCKRCKPDGLSIDGANAAIVARACRLIE